MRILLVVTILTLPFTHVIAQSPALPVAATADPGTGVEGGAVPLEIWKYALTQGGLTIVCLVLFWWITRKAKDDGDDKKILIGLVDKNTTALTTMDQTCQRLARALEDRR